MSTASRPLKWHGGKHYLAEWIISHFPPRCQTPNKPTADDDGWLHYVEPYFGGGAVLFAHDPEGISEVVNDINEELWNFWATLAHPDLFPEFARVCEATPFSKSEFEIALKRFTGDSVPIRAIKFFIRYRQSRQGLGKDFATLTRNRTRRGMNEQVSAWLSAVEGLPEAHERLKRVVILNDDALKVIKQQDGPRTLFYLDPPYLHETRHGSGANGDYEHEMGADDHEELLLHLADIKGRFVLSGYRSDLYDTQADDSNWRRVEKEIDNKASGKKSKDKKVECLWMNF